MTKKNKNQKYQLSGFGAMKFPVSYGHWEEIEKEMKQLNRTRTYGKIDKVKLGLYSALVLTALNIGLQVYSFSQKDKENSSPPEMQEIKTNSLDSILVNKNKVFSLNNPEQ